MSSEPRPFLMVIIHQSVHVCSGLEFKPHAPIDAKWGIYKIHYAHLLWHVPASLIFIIIIRGISCMCQLVYNYYQRNKSHVPASLIFIIIIRGISRTCLWTPSIKDKYVYIHAEQNYSYFVLWLHQRSKASVVVYTTYTTCLTTAMVYGSYTLVYNCHIP